MMNKINHALEYANAVLSGEIIAGNKIKQACERYLSDLERSKNDEFSYYYDVSEANRAVNFIELLPSTNGEPLELFMFQKWIVSELYGWREKGSGNRRYNRAFISMSRKNGKTFLISGIGALALLMENEPAEGRQVLFVSNALKQARLGYEMMRNSLSKVAKKSKYMRKRLKLLNSRITDLESNSFAQALASDTSTLDGFSPTCAIIDEWHEAKTRDTYNVLKSGMANQKNGLLCTISTSGLSTNVPMFEEYQLLEKVLNGETEADRYFVGIWELDNAEEVHDESLWQKANPIFENEEIKNTMLPAIRDDVKIAIAQNNLNPVLVKNFNLWRNASEHTYIAHGDWKNAEIEQKPNIKGRDVYIGCDLSKSNDLSSVSWIVPLDNKTFYVDSFSFVATKYGLQEKIRRDHIDYIRLEEVGECSITKLESGIIDYEEIYSFIMRFIEENELNVLGFCYDPWNANSLITMLEKAKMPLLEVRQGVITLNTPTRTFREQLYDGKIVHPKNELLEIAINNAILKTDNNGVMINKSRNSNRIDPVDALLNAYTEAFYYFDDKEGEKADNEFFKSENFSF